MLTGLPEPNTVFSGGGIHCYWAFDRDLGIDEWRPLAAALKAAMLQHKPAIEALITEGFTCKIDALVQRIKRGECYPCRNGEPRPHVHDVAEMLPRAGYYLD